MIDWTFRMSDLLIVAGFVGTLVLYSYKMGGFTQSVNIMNKRLESVETTQKAIASVITTLAVQKVQIERMERDINGLKRGEGYIKYRETVEGEY